MEGERLGRVVAVTLLALLTPLACAVFGFGTPVASGLPPSIGSAPPAALTGGGVEATQPLTDEAFLKSVRQTVLWAIPAGQQAEQQAVDEQLKDIGRELADDLTALGDEATAVATALGVELPDKASEDQERWLDELASTSGADYDLLFANRLRGALGELFLAAAQTRAGTSQAEVRAFASAVNDVVDRQMTDLENTGLVTDDAPTEPGRPDSTSETALGPATAIPEESQASSSTTEGGDVSVGLIVLICVAEAGLTVGLVHFFRSR
jgi:predicted outer membrane protein